MNATTQVTVRVRMNAVAYQRMEPMGSPMYRALNAARYWESFPHSYSAEQVELAGRFLVAVADTAPERFELGDEVLELLARAGGVGARLR